MRALNEGITSFKALGLLLDGQPLPFGKARAIVRDDHLGPQEGIKEKKSISE